MQIPWYMYLAGEEQKEFEATPVLLGVTVAKLEEKFFSFS